MGLYADHVEPRLVSLACGAPGIERTRATIVPAAEGRVLEIGFGSGRNLPYYDERRVSDVVLLEPSAAMRTLAARRLAKARVPIRVLAAGAEAVPLPNASVDTVLVTYTLCTLPDPSQALDEARRVLRPGGRLLFAEHGLAPDPSVAAWQRRVQPVWGRLAGGCRLTRDAPSALHCARFEIVALEQRYLPSAPRLAGFVSMGTATPRTV